MTATMPRAPRKHRVLRRVVAYSASRGVTEGLLAVRGVTLAALVGPAAFGIWALVRLTMRYVAMVSLCAYRGLELELFAQPGGESAPAARLGEPTARAALGFVWMAIGTIVAVAVGASYLVSDPRHALMLRGFAGAALFEQTFGYVLVCVRVRQDLRRYAILETTHAALQLVCVVALAWAGGLTGAFVGLAVASAIAVAIGSRHAELRPALHWPVLKRLLHVGVPLAANVMLTSALATADRWIVAGFGGVTMLGYYAFAAQIASIAVTFAWVIRTVIFPDVYRHARADRSQAVAALRMHLERAVVPFARLVPPLLGAMSFVVGPVLVHVLPRYTAAVGPARIFLLSGAASGIVGLAAIGAVAAGKQYRLPIFSSVALVLNLALSFLAVTHGAGLELVAAASFAGQVVFAAGVLALVRHESGASDVRLFLTRTLGPLAWSVGLVVFLGAIFPVAKIGSAAVALVLYLVLLAPLAPAMRADWRRVTA